MTISESQIEDVFAVFYKDLISEELTFLDRQCTIGDRRVDLLFADKEKRRVIVELKRDAPTREDVGQLLEYAGLVENPRVILAAPMISSRIKIAFDHYGIEYLEFNLRKISELYESIKHKPKTGGIGYKIKVPDEIISEPLERNTSDGNIAFKVTYVGSTLIGVCSDNLYEYNRAHRVWCGHEDCKCRSRRFRNPQDLDEENYPCYDSIALKTLRFQSGYYHPRKSEPTHSRNREYDPKRCLRAKKDKLALFTSRKPPEPESERFIFAIGQMTRILPGSDEECELFICDPKTAITFENRNYPKFWKYYRINSDKKIWGSGLFRYITDQVARSFLSDIVSGQSYSGSSGICVRTVEK